MAADEMKSTGRAEGYGYRGGEDAPRVNPYPGDRGMGVDAAHMPGVGALIERLEKVVSETQEEFNCLHKRLSPVSEPEPTQGNDGAKADGFPRNVSEYSNRLMKLESQLGALRSFITATIDRLQV